MLHPYQEASAMERPVGPCPSALTPGQELLLLLSGVGERLDTGPAILSLQNPILYVLYRNEAILTADFWEFFGVCMARINSTWPICAYGTAENQETIRLSAVIRGERVRLTQQSLSGNSADVLRTLCFQIDCADDRTATALTAVLSRMNWTAGQAAMDWKDADFLREHKLILAPESRSFFCYAGIEPAGSARDRLLSLDFSQKITLWIAFLQDGFEPEEFEGLAQEIEDGTIANRMEWELALREAMDQLHFRLVNKEKTFQLYDGAGRRLYFGADGRQTAAWVMLKILFPLNFAP